MKLVIDIESNNLLNKALDYSNLPYRLKPEFKIWCVVVTNKDTKESVSFYKESLTKDNLRKALKGCTELIGHNIIGYDLPILYLYGLLDYNVGYPEQSSSVFGTDTLITDTLLWSKLLEPDRFLGHSLKAWGKRLGNAKTEFDDWSQFSQEQLDYCIQDTKVNCDVYDALVLEKATADWDRAYRMEAKLADLTLKQELLGFDFNMDLAKKTLEELDSLMLVTANKVNPILPPKKLTKGKIQEFTMPKLRFKKDGTLSSVFQKWLNKHGAKFVLDSLDNNDYLLYKGKKFYIKDELPLETTEVATVDDVDVVKGYLLNLGWVPSEIKERNLTVNTDKTKRDYKAIIKAIDAYVEQTKESVFMKLRLEALNTDLRSLRQFLINKIDGSKPIYVPTTPMLRVGVEKELCPNLIRLGDKAEVAGIVAEYYTYRHRRNSIAGGTLDEDGEPITGYMSQVREDGRIATPADTLGANTGRYKHKGVCNVPRTTSLFGEKMRSLFGSGRGLHQLGYDFASLEARIMGHYVLPYDGEELANALLASKPDDLHSQNSRKLGIDRGSAKSFSYACLPMDTKVLTMQGWKYYTEIQEGDKLLTYNADKDIVESDSVLLKHYFKDKPVFQYSNKRDSFRCTEEHRWYGYRRSKTRKGSKKIYGYFEAKSFTQEHNLVLTAPYVGGNSTVTRDEAELMGYILSDGYYRWSTKSDTTSSSNGVKKGVKISISQSANKFVDEIKDLLFKLDMQYSISKFEPLNNNTICNFYIKAESARSFLERVVGNRIEKENNNWTEWVCNLSRDALEGFYLGFYNGDGDSKTGTKTITQNVGNIHEAVVTASQLLGLGRVSLSKHSGTNKTCETIRIQKRKHMSMQEQKVTELGVQDTFCLTTKNSSFIIWQGDFIGITGNCIYGAQPKKLAKMLGITESKAKELFNAYWEAVLPLKQLKLQLEKAWEARGKKFIKGIDGRLLHTRSKHSLINVLFQSGGAISVKWSLVRLAQYLEELNMLGNPFEHTKQDMKVWFLIAYHDEAQLALNPKLIDVKLYGTEEEAKANLAEGSSAIGHSHKGYYVAYRTQVVECIEKSIQKAQEELNLRVELGFEWIVGRNWGQCH